MPQKFRDLLAKDKNLSLMGEEEEDFQEMESPPAAQMEMFSAETPKASIMSTYYSGEMVEADQKLKSYLTGADDRAAAVINKAKTPSPSSKEDSMMEDYKDEEEDVSI